MQRSQGNPQYRYLKETKMSFFFLLQNQRTGGQNKSCQEGGWYQLERKRCGKWCKMVNMVRILCTHECKGKNETC
jgi:abortive infection bacteriophage resistance protein